MKQLSNEELYRQARAEICRLVTPENEATLVPACPEWSLHDLVAHLTGLLDDFTTGNLDGVPGDAWTARQVERYRHTPLPDLFSIWDRVTDAACVKLAPLDIGYLPDIVAHELDIRGALGNTDARDTERIDRALVPFVGWANDRFCESGTPPMRVQLPNATYTLGDGEPEITLSTSAFEFSRVVVGRRSTSQIRALNWSADPTPWQSAIAPFGNRDTDLIE